MDTPPLIRRRKVQTRTPPHLEAELGPFMWIWIDEEDTMPEPEKSEHAKAVGEMMEKDRELSPAEAAAALERKFGEMQIPKSDRPNAASNSSDRMMQFFRYEHLPPHLQVVSRPFGILATTIIDNLPSNAERTVALRKLLEAKDAAVRAVLYEG